jgi:hypothetical protein
MTGERNRSESNLPFWEHLSEQFRPDPEPKQRRKDPELNWSLPVYAIENASMHCAIHIPH